jgi:hypothetical protein
LNNIVNNIGISRLFNEFIYTSFANNDDMIRASINFNEFWSVPLILSNTDGISPDRLEVVLNDNFTGLTNHTFGAFYGITDND